ncbi:MAG TPA: MlaD family protein, partial [Acidimicrobiales bacterium]
MVGKHQNPVFRPLIKFTIYAIVCLLLLFALAARVGNLTPPTTHRDMYHAVLANADSLVNKDNVKIAGVTVGQVHGVKVHQGKAIVTF